ncbi:four-helix bundle copper-binding protein [Haloarchaeobius iranensis]|uniref:Four-helix bundle copper-binding protein n=1 Tax=Haloarchaeobius iranensis TaxID=996166 RepID=A0A1H0B5Q2_9EURY|nr:four-helix bundle copper-binding protein [Haloarchaeobius iranensis]SDN40987.1 hypothetical protein SAMN05192554_1346 [Haloarchaeobius iranensis]
MYQPTQSGHQQVGGTQPRGLTFEDTLTRDMRVALHDFEEVATVCNWCAEECLGEMGMEECARLCQDVADLAILNVQFIARDSPFGIDLAETFAYAAEECERECAQHPHDHCQECAAVLRRAVDSTWAMLDAFESIPQGRSQVPSQQY